MKRINTTLAVLHEVGEFLNTVISGHAPEPLSPKAERVYRQMLEAEGEFIMVIDGKEYPSPKSK